MKSSDLSKVVGASVLALSVAILPLSLPASAQTSTEPNPTNVDNNGPVLDTTPFQETRGVADNWGWLGLIGLLGLLNLFRKGEEPGRYTELNQSNSSVTTEEPVRYTDPNEMNRPVTTEEPVRYREPYEGNSSVNTEEAVRYRDPNEVRRSDNTEK